ncbi:hypothetical protein SAMN04489859_1001146 [Paracoccus alcaliphilus]|uniref:DUF1850 domain-containing protein n=1 Tax=Paracoccus alcaliphilus TaxID=34002 RepID=A0A1H8E3Z8_9RHOB|nr:DUF1850 domain-containing protein [Paracoccus alcaliphilus]WCR16818.1 DUF1850 domain-containing protein [Paracoccus alcaliphilus]SEN13497.1 hypothetical protein SAMN04489859_1001146 [Paracoccus alcaliphilus]
MICIAAAGAIMALAADQFTLRWTHSVTRTTWEERWQADPEGLHPVEAFVVGPGAGVEIPDHARRVSDGWRFSVDLPPQKQVFLAASGATDGGWTLCAGAICHELGRSASEPLRLWQAGDCSDPIAE